MGKISIFVIWEEGGPEEGEMELENEVEQKRK